MKKGDIWFMGYPAKEIWRNFFSVVAGVFVALIIMLPLMLLAGLLVFSDARVPDSQVLISNILMIVSVISGSLAGGYTTAKISTKSIFVHILITATVLVFLYLIINDFDLSYLRLIEKLFIPFIIFFTFIGGYIVKRKKIIPLSNNHSSPPDTPSQ